MDSDPDSVNSSQRASFSGRGWRVKFANAFRGVACAVRDRGNSPWQNSFLIHVPATIAVLVLAYLKQLDRVSVCLLVGCIALVWVSELINSSIEALARAVTDQPNEQVRMSLDIASGAVLIASLTAMVVGAILLWG